MSNGTMGDPKRCAKTLAVLARTSITLGIGAAGHYTFQQFEKVSDLPETARLAKFGSRFIPGFAIGLSTLLLHKSKLLLWPDQLVRRIWSDCGDDDWLKKHLNRLREKLKPLDLAPASQPLPIPVSMRSENSDFCPEIYAVSAEMIANRSTSVETYAKGAGWAVATTAVAAISAAFYILGARNVPSMQATPAGFGMTTYPSLFSSDQNQIL